MALESDLWEVNEGSVSIHRVIAIKKMTTDVVIISFYGKFSLLIWSLQNSVSFWTPAQEGFRHQGPMT